MYHQGLVDGFEGEIGKRENEPRHLSKPLCSGQTVVAGEGDHNLELHEGHEGKDGADGHSDDLGTILNYLDLLIQLVNTCSVSWFEKTQV